ncbi:MAG: prolyl oligopeptidase family serine peptidase [Phycisphaerae bacterium]|nr:prolyl oligopeptidase family serine peptidase [Phycisphaerae bacterium]
MSRALFGCRPMIAGLLIATVPLMSGSAFAQNRAHEAQRRAASAPALPEGFVAKELKTSDGQVRRYALFLPRNYDAKKKWPVILFLHGSAESGTDGIRHTQVGLGPFLWRHRKTCPMIGIFPQGRTWFRGAEARAVFEILDATMQEYSADPDRVYLTGLSMGGFGTWELAMIRPDLFAAIVPICGGAQLDALHNLVKMPIWCFHGALDDRVPVQLSGDLIAKLKKLGAKPKFTVFPKTGHVCWDEAYETKDLFRWLLKQRRPRPPSRLVISMDLEWCPVPTTLWWVRVEQAEPGAKSIRVSAEVQPQGTVELNTEGVQACSLVFDESVERTETPARVVWNGRPAYEGPWKARIPLTRADSDAPR